LQEEEDLEKTTFEQDNAVLAKLLKFGGVVFYRKDGAVDRITGIDVSSSKPVFTSESVPASLEDIEVMKKFIKELNERGRGQQNPCNVSRITFAELALYAQWFRFQVRDGLIEFVYAGFSEELQKTEYHKLVMKKSS
jgi:hypothetical protein